MADWTVTKVHPSVEGPQKCPVSPEPHCWEGICKQALWLGELCSLQNELLHCSFWLRLWKRLIYLCFLKITDLEHLCTGYYYMITTSSFFVGTRVFSDPPFSYLCEHCPWVFCREVGRWVWTGDFSSLSSYMIVWYLFSQSSPESGDYSLAAILWRMSVVNYWNLA